MGRRRPPTAAILTILWLLSEVQMQMQRETELELEMVMVMERGIWGWGCGVAHCHASHMPVAKFALAQVKRRHRVDNGVAACQ